MLDKSKYTSLKAKYLYGIIITAITVSTVSAIIRFFITDYVIVAGDIIMISVILLISYNYEKNGDFSRAVIQMFWLSSIIIFIFIVYTQYNLLILLVILMPLLASVLLDVKQFLFHGAIFLSLFFLIMLYGFLNRENYHYLNDINFLISFTILFIFVLVHSTIYNNTMRNSYLQLQKSDKQKAFLLKEIHHRVKNNLNIVASILGLEKFESNTEEVHKLIAQNKLRIESIAMVHEILYKSEDLENIDFKTYLSKLTEHILATESREDNIQLHLDIVELKLSIEAMIQFGIIINELVTNSIKHAFGEKAKNEEGNIYITLQKHEVHYVLTYKDDGIGLHSEHKGFGQNLISISAQQLGAEVKMTSQDGFNYTFSFRKENT